jgi:hypothetical protein
MVSRYVLGALRRLRSYYHVVRNLPAHRHIERIKTNSKAIGRRRALGLVTNVSNILPYNS